MELKGSRFQPHRGSLYVSLSKVLLGAFKNCLKETFHMACFG